jgi:hypothetical protein
MDKDAQTDRAAAQAEQDRLRGAERKGAREAKGRSYPEEKEDPEEWADYSEDAPPDEPDERESDSAEDFELAGIADGGADAEESGTHAIDRETPGTPDAPQAPGVPKAPITHDSSDTQSAMPDESGSKAAELEQVMASGMEFLAGLFKMSTGRDLGLDSRSISVDRDTGEFTMKFRLPV